MALNNYMDRVLTARLRASAGSSEKVELGTEVVKAAGAKFDEGIAGLLADEMKSLGPDELSRWLEGLPDSSCAAWLRAQIHPEPVKAEAAWERFFQLHAGRDPLHLMACARVLSDAGRHEQAALKLRLALTQPVRYSFFARAGNLIRQIAGNIDSWSRTARIAILGSSTTTLLAPVLEALCFRDRIRTEIYQGLYGAVQQEILNPDSGLASFRPDIVILVSNWRDLNLSPLTADEDGFIESVVRERKELWATLARSFNCHTIQPAFDFPAEESWGYLGGALRGGRTRVIERLNLRMREEAPATVSVLDTPAAQRETGSARWEDEASWSRFRQHPSTEALPALAEAQLAHIRAVLGLTRKVLVTDLDNTLWHGVIGEDGLHGIGIGPGTPQGEAHQRLQQYLRDLKDRGIVLAVCSKNNPEDARLPFEQHPHMVLRLDDFAVFRANWEDKVANLRALAQDLSLGLDSFVFLDDNPLEREWVRSQLPQVTVVELGSTVFSYLRDLDRSRLFQALTLSAEDISRAEQYRVEAQRETLRTTAASMDEFLSQMQLEALVESVTPKNLARVTQLVNKTNQFNVTTRRYTEAQVSAIASDPGGWAGAFHMSDRMGSYGLIGVLFCRPGGSTDGWEIDSWLMSCRTLGRQMEKFMFDRLVEAAVSRKVHRLIGVFRPTAKNALVKELYDSLGFVRVSESGEEIRYELMVQPGAPFTATHVKNVSVAAAEVACP